ncbi:uncharacterized protein LOC106880179 [Octopus bimaculoides]|uniref:CARD domain-containing protein n=1 Tax=Octopus bimaculoides TaxID=37653 RepID=A0A0L8FZA5_OCTBM|nr:uncharacterized protein LOC106880179 [Octopus bimaculoides]XP_014785512.1 uncharacterized protein LOC106880179 [Octopus bimaculoides]XP_014785513.1 uncharacterized protein LOC106880179 [Octopus bimaculoides]XP_014785514.1 uncharacterized protein LOC106880179 [Octopus bimaculoides]XP_014785515.1 uncharacterized protein LOC106880179 [Octopus bimaculoides]XP_014785516.1 uncharacterized protein LOC106880179 [Octopus bimaculoides]XP_052828049.1 uncharacterized protein LOC106880179 [Octopus bima|eukprot:XP_014785511.1 PREDICTED: uncharacterized protein LOC106880179 [Octopus bimaculoides]
MVAEKLSNREDLIENLDSEPVFDYLLQHGVISKETYNDINEEKDMPLRNQALLQHLEGLHSSNAMALFINALRQSGQLDLASSLDYTKRIKPVHGTGYLQRDRYKGQVAIRIQVEAVKALVPKMELLDRVSVEDLSSSTGTHSVEISFSPSRRRHCSYENMTLLESPEEGANIQPHLIKEYAYSHEDDDDIIKPKRCWCICFPSLFRRKKDPKQKKHNVPNRRDRTQQVTPPDISRYTNVVTSSPSTRIKWHEERASLNGKYYLNRKSSKSHRNENPNITDIVHYKNSLNESHYSSPESLKSRHSGNSVLIQGYRRDSNSIASSKNSMFPGPSPAKQGMFMSLEQGRSISRKVELAEEWRGDGEVLDEKAHRFYVLFDSAGNSHYTNLIKYFEQDRGTLVMSALRRDTLVVMNICMTKDQLKQLQSDYSTGKLTRDIEQRLVNMQVLNAVDAKELRLSTIIDDSEFSQAEEELG